MKKAAFYWYVYVFSVNYDAIAVDYMLKNAQIFKGKEWYNIKWIDLSKNDFYSKYILWLQCIKCKSIKMCLNE